MHKRVSGKFNNTDLCSWCRSPDVTYLSQVISFWVNTPKKKFPLWTNTTVSRCPKCSGRKYFLFVPNEWSVIHSTFVTADTLGTVISSAIAGCKKWPSFWSRTAIQTRKYCWGNIVSFSFSGIAKSAERKQNVVLSRWPNEATIGPFYLTKNSGVNFRIRVANGTEFSRRLQQSEKR